MFASHASTRHRTAHASRAGFIARLRMALEARSQRRALARFDARMLRDIGVSRAQAEAEVNRPLWDVPSNWLR